MIELLAQLIFGFIIALTGALIPGPLSLFVVTTTVKTGEKKTGLSAGLGHCLVEIIIIAIIVMGLTTLFSSQQFQIAVNLIGGGALIMFGVLNIRTTKTTQTEIKTAKARGSSLIGGVVFTIFNATIPLWWATTGLMMLNHALLTTSMLGVFFWVIGHWIADLLWFGFLGYSVHKGKRYIGEEFHLSIIKICGLAMIFLGTFFVLSIFYR